MGCSSPKEKLEDEMMKIQMSRIEIQMERYNQIEMLKEINGGEIKSAVIADYIDQQFLNNHFYNKRNSSSSTSESSKSSKEENQKRAKRSKNCSKNKRKKILNSN